MRLSVDSVLTNPSISLYLGMLASGEFLYSLLALILIKALLKT